MTVGVARLGPEVEVLQQLDDVRLRAAPEVVHDDLSIVARLDVERRPSIIVSRAVRAALTLPGRRLTITIRLAALQRVENVLGGDDTPVRRGHGRISSASRRSRKAGNV